VIVCIHCRRYGRSLNNRYGPGSGQIWLDDLQCIGTETQLGSCRHNGWGYHNCRHSDDVSIVCIDPNLPLTSTTTTSTSSTTSTASTVLSTSTAPRNGIKFIFSFSPLVIIRRFLFIHRHHHHYLFT